MIPIADYLCARFNVPKWLILPCFLILMLGYPVWHEVAYWKPTMAKIPEIEAESKVISAPPEDVLVNESSSHKSGQVLVDRSYESKLTYPQLRVYYDAQLERHGWRFVGETTIHDWGRDLGGKEAFYKKADDTATLQYAGKKADNGWSYAIDFSWGL
jgi:hypothetical protein